MGVVYALGGNIMRLAAISSITIIFGLLFAAAGSVSAAQICTGFGPQTPRDITSVSGTNKRLFTLAPAATQLNLC